MVERLLWEQDAAGSNPVIRTTQRELPLWAVLFVFSATGTSAASCEQSKVLALGERGDRRQWRSQGSRVSGRGLWATKPHRRQGAHRAPQQAAKPKMPQVRILSSGPRKENCPLRAVLFVFSYRRIVRSILRAKQGACFGGTRRPPPVADEAT